MTQKLNLVILSTGLDSLRELRDALTADGRARLLGGRRRHRAASKSSRTPAPARRRRHARRAARGRAQVRRAAGGRVRRRRSSSAPRATPRPTSSCARCAPGAREFLRLPVIPEEFKTVYAKRRGGLRRAARDAEEARARRRRLLQQGRVRHDLRRHERRGRARSADRARRSEPARGRPRPLPRRRAEVLHRRPRREPRARGRLAPEELPRRRTRRNLSLLAAPREADSADDIEPEHVFQVLELLRERFDYVVIDPQHTFDAITLARARPGRRHPARAHARHPRHPQHAARAANLRPARLPAPQGTHRRQPLQPPDRPRPPAGRALPRRARRRATCRATTRRRSTPSTSASRSSSRSRSSKIAAELRQITAARHRRSPGGARRGGARRAASGRSSAARRQSTSSRVLMPAAAGKEKEPAAA